MEGYKFRLQKLLDIRVDKEEESKRSFKKAQLEKEKVEERLNNLKENYNKHRTSETAVTLVEQKLKHMYLNALSNSIMETNIELEDRKNNLENKREILKQTQIERKTVETLKDKQLKAFVKERELVEQKSNDEFALYGYLRTRERR